MAMMTDDETRLLNLTKKEIMNLISYHREEEEMWAEDRDYDRAIFHKKRGAQLEELL